MTDNTARPIAFPPLGIRKRFVIFSAVWLTLCTVALTAYLISQTRQSLLEVAVQHALGIAMGMAKDATLYLHAGDDRGMDKLLADIRKQPDVISTTVEQDQHVWGRPVTRLETLGLIGAKQPTGALRGAVRLVRADGHRAIEAREPIWVPAQSDLLVDQPQVARTGPAVPVGSAVVIVSVERIFQEIDGLVTKAMMFWGVVLAVGLGVGWLLSGMMVSPLTHLAHRARQWTDSSQEATSSRDEAMIHDDELRSLWSSLTAMKRELDRKTTEITRLQGSVEDTVKQHTADLQEMNRRLSEILALKNQLLLQISHEIRTPLTALSALVSNLHDGVVGEPTLRQREYLARAQAITLQVRGLLTTLLEFAMAETGKIHLSLRPIDVATVAAEALDALHPLQEERAVSCVIAESMHGQWALADADRVQQILLNLVHNAIKASPPRSSVVMDARTEGAEVVVSVRDSGAGIRPADRAILLREPAPSDRRPKGSGVGLCICRYLVELHGGRIWFESEEDKGTTFFFSLPTAPVPAAITS